MMSPAQDLTVAGATGSSTKMVILLTLAYAIAMIDRTILVLLIGPLQRDLQISDTQFGLLQGAAFAAFYVLAGLPIGLAIDRLPRVRIISAGLLLWSCATVASAFAGGFATLFAARVAVAVGEASLNPAAYSLLASTFPKARLGKAIGIFSTGAAIGTGLAFLVGGALLAQQRSYNDFVVPIIGPMHVWQLAFLVAGVPGLILAAFISRLREPTRQKQAKVPLAGRWWPFFLAHRRALLLVFGASSCQTMLLYTFMTWSPALLLRSHGFSGGQAGLVLGLSNVVFGIAGFYSGGYLADRWWKQGRADAHMRVGFLAHCLILPLGLLASLATSWTLAVPALCLLNFLQFGTGPAAITGLQLMTPADLRGRSSAILLMATTMAGVGLGPLMVALLNDYLFHSPAGVGLSMAIVVAVVTPLGIILFAKGRSAVAARILAASPA